MPRQPDASVVTEKGLVTQAKGSGPTRLLDPTGQRLYSCVPHISQAVCKDFLFPAPTTENIGCRRALARHSGCAGSALGVGPSWPPPRLRPEGASVPPTCMQPRARDGGASWERILG